MRSLAIRSPVLVGKGFVIENLLAAAPPGTAAHFYRTQAGAEIDLVLGVAGRERILGYRS